MVGRGTVVIAGTAITATTEEQLATHVLSHMERGTGGWIVTANVDILRQAARVPVARRLIDAADVVVADGMPLLWAARLSGTPLPERVTGASLLWTLSRSAATAGAPVFVIGGPPGAADAAGGSLVEAHPSLELAGTACPPHGFEHDEAQLDDLCRQVAAAGPGLVLVGLGFPKQEVVIARLRRSVPSAWYLGCGAAVAFAAGDIPRAPRWMQDAGLEWVHRLTREPRRLGRRYLREDAPFTVALLVRSAIRRSSAA